MRIRRNANNVNGETRWHLWVLVSGTCVALLAAALTFPVKSVLADALLSRPAAVSASALSPTPAMEGAGEAKKTVLDPMLKGIASWYGPRFNGRLTASGERFDMYAMTACHPTLPFGTVVRVKDMENLRTVVVRITDRGDLMPGRVIDLSYGAATSLHMVHDGLAPVTIEVLKDGKSGTAN
jgi:rare lipoprotein A